MPLETAPQPTPHSSPVGERPPPPPRPVMLRWRASTCRETGRRGLILRFDGWCFSRFSTPTAVCSLPRLLGRVLPCEEGSGKEERSLMDCEPFIDLYPIWSWSSEDSKKRKVFLKFN